MENAAAESLTGLWIIVAIVLVLSVFNGLFLYATTRTERVTITQVRFGQDQGFAKYMIYTRDGQVLKNVNSVFFMKFKSDELFMKLKAGKTYEIKTCGVRVPFLGWYKNIISAKEIKPTKTRKK